MKWKLGNVLGSYWGLYDYLGIMEKKMDRDFHGSYRA